MLSITPMLSLPMFLVLVIALLVLARGIVELIDYKQQKSSHNVVKTLHEQSKPCNQNYNIKRNVN